MQQQSGSYKPKIQKEIRRYDNNQVLNKDKTSSKVLNTSTPTGNPERGHTSSPLNKTGISKNFKNYQNILSQLDPSSTKNSKTYLQVSKILNPKKNEFLKQYLKSTLNSSKKPSQKTLDTPKEAKNPSKENPKDVERREREPSYSSKLDIILSSMNNGRFTTSHKTGSNIDKNEIMKSFISPKSTVMHSRVNKSGIITTTVNKDGNETFNFRPVNEKDSYSAKNGRKSVENPYSHAAALNDSNQRGQLPQKILTDLDESLNFSPSKMKQRSTTTKAREEITNIISQTYTRKAEDARSKKFKFNEEKDTSSSIKFDGVELSPIRPATKHSCDNEKKTRQGVQYQSHGQLNIPANTSSVDLSNTRKSKGTVLKSEDKDSLPSSATHLEGSNKKPGYNPLNAHIYPTIVKQINLITANTPTSFGKPPLPTNTVPTPQHGENTKINFEGLKANNYLNIQTVKENKRFEFPSYLNNYTCDRKTAGVSSSFTLEAYKPDLVKDNSQKLSFHDINAEANRYTPPKQRNCSEDPRHRKQIPEISDSPRIIQAIKANTPKQLIRQSSGPSYLIPKPHESPEKKQINHNFEIPEAKSKTPKNGSHCEQGRSSVHSTNHNSNQIQPQSCKNITTQDVSGIYNSENNSFHNQTAQTSTSNNKKISELLSSHKDMYVPREGRHGNPLLNITAPEVPTNPRSSGVSSHNHTIITTANTTTPGTICLDNMLQRQENNVKDRDREKARRNFSEEKENICTENDYHRQDNHYYRGGHQTPSSATGPFNTHGKDNETPVNDGTKGNALKALDNIEQDTADGERGRHSHHKAEKPKEITILDQDSATKEVNQMRFREEYLIGKQVGQGAYAVVRLSIHKPTNRKVAIKIYEKQKIMDPMRRKSVRREIKLMQKMDHANIIKIHETFETGNHVHIVMEYVGGASLHGFLKMQPNRRLSEERAYKTFRQVVAGILYCHSRCITHRDIKLENLLMDEQGNIKIIDFGFSTCIPNDKRVKMFCGTPSYMAPEIVMKKEYCGPPADVWALGVLLYALLCGTFPFKGANDKELYKRIARGEFYMPDHLSENATALLKRMICVEAEKRPTTKEIMNDPWMLTHAFLEKRDNLSQSRKSQSVERVSTVGSDRNEPVRSSNQNQIRQNNSSMPKEADIQTTTVQINNYLKQHQNPVMTEVNHQNAGNIISQLNKIQSCKNSNTIKPHGFPPGNLMAETPQHCKKIVVGLDINSANSKPCVNFSFESSNRAQSAVRTGHTPTHSTMTNNYFLNNKTYNLNFKDENNAKTPVNNHDRHNDTDVFHFDDFETADSRDKTVKKRLDVKMPGSHNGSSYNNISPFKFNTSESKANYNKKTDARSSLNANIFHFTASISNKNGQYDLDVVSNMVKLGYKEEEVFESLKDKNSTLYSIYTKLANDKRVIHNQIAPTYIPSVVNSVTSLPSQAQSLSGIGFVSPSHNNLRVARKGTENTAVYGRSSTFLDMSGISNKDNSFVYEKKGRATTYIEQSRGEQQHSDIYETDAIVRLSQNN